MIRVSKMMMMRVSKKIMAMITMYGGLDFLLQFKMMMRMKDELVKFNANI